MPVQREKPFRPARVRATAACALLAVAVCPARAHEDSAPLSVRIAGKPSLDAPGEAEIDLGGGLIELLLTGEIRPRLRGPERLVRPVAAAPVAAAPVPVPPSAQAAQPPGPDLVPYGGDLPAGTVIVNETRREVYRVVGPGLAQRYRPVGDVLSLAKLLTPK